MRTKHICILIHNRKKGDIGTIKSGKNRSFRNGENIQFNNRLGFIESGNEN